MKSFLTKWRYWTAIGFGLLTHLNLFGLKMQKLCAVGYSCHGCPWASFGCPIGTISYQLSIKKLPFTVIGLLLLVGLLVGRAVCGLLCPFGMIQDWLYKIKTPKFKLPQYAKYIKYAILAIIVIGIPYFMGQNISGYIKITNIEIKKNEQNKKYPEITVTNTSFKTVKNPTIRFFQRNKDGSIINYYDKEFDIEIKPNETKILKGNRIMLPRKNVVYEAHSPQGTISKSLPIPLLYFCRICQIGTFTAAIPVTAENKNWTNFFKTSYFRLILGILTFICIIFISRFYCRVFCPIGAIYGITNKFALYKPQCDKTKCVKCGKCSSVCPIELNVPNEIGNSECITCGDCIKVCPTKALKRKVNI